MCKYPSSWFYLLNRYLVILELFLFYVLDPSSCMHHTFDRQITQYGVLLRRVTLIHRLVRGRLLRNHLGIRCQRHFGRKPSNPELDLFRLRSHLLRLWRHRHDCGLHWMQYCVYEQNPDHRDHVADFRHSDGYWCCFDMVDVRSPRAMIIYSFADWNTTLHSVYKPTLFNN